MERYSMFMDWKNQHCKNGHTTQSNLQIQCNPYQITHDIFHRTATNNPKIHVEPQKTQNCQSNSEEQKPSRRHLSLSDFRQYYKSKSLRQCSTGTKTERQNNGTEENP